MLLDKYENFIFHPCSRPAVGEYTKTFFLSGYYTPATVQRILNIDVPFVTPREKEHVRQKKFTTPKSRLYAALLVKNNTACIVNSRDKAGRTAVSAAQLLDEVRDMCTVQKCPADCLEYACQQSQHSFLRIDS